MHCQHQIVSSTLLSIIDVGLLVMVRGYLGLEARHRRLGAACRVRMMLLTKDWLPNKLAFIFIRSRSVVLQQLHYLLCTQSVAALRVLLRMSHIHLATSLIDILADLLFLAIFDSAPPLVVKRLMLTPRRTADKSRP